MLSRLNQDALDSCKMRIFLKHKCFPPQDQIPTLETDSSHEQVPRKADENKDHQTQLENAEETENYGNDIQEIQQLEEMDPDINTTVWIEKDQTANVHSKPQPQTTNSNSKVTAEKSPNVHQENDQEKNVDQGNDQLHNLDQQNHQDVHPDAQAVPQVHQESNHEQAINQGTDIHQSKDQQLDQDIHLEVQPDPAVPQRITRSKINISKNSTKYDCDYV